MTFEEALQHEDKGKLVAYENGKYYVIGHNKLTQTVTIREASSNPSFTVPIDVKPEELS